MAADPDTFDFDLSGAQPPHWSARIDTEAPSVQVLSSFDINTADSAHPPPLIYAIKASRREWALALLEHGADPLCTDAYFQTPFHFAAISDDVELLIAIARHFGAHSRPDHLGETPLHCAVQHSAFKAADALLTLRADTAARDHLQRSPSSLAAEINSPLCIKLIGLCAALSAPTARNPTEAHAAARAGHMDLLHLMLTQHQQLDWSLLDDLDSTGRAPIHYAAEQAHAKALISLISAGADVALFDAAAMSAAMILEALPFSPERDESLRLLRQS